MDDPSNLSDLAELGRLAAAKQVKPEHLPAAFDLKAQSIGTEREFMLEYEPELTWKGCAVQRSYDRRTRTREAALSAR